MSLPPGSYHIYSGDAFVGRALHEDFSLLPKRVYALADGVQPYKPWIVQRLPNGLYRLQALEAPVAEIRGFLFAVLIDSGEATEWVITPQPNNLFTIQKPSGGAGWVRTDENVGPESQIAVKLDDSDRRFFRFELVVD